MATPHQDQQQQQQQIELYPGFRFHPTDEELITHYLAPKVHDRSFKPVAMGEADLNKLEPWELPGVAKMGEDEWYFFCLRDKKYPTGMRTNRATKSGYWKATGKDKQIYSGKSLVGMKKTLVFYRGRAPKGLKTNWVIHEYRLEGIFSPLSLPNTPKSDWVISRVFNKSSSGKKTHISALRGLSSHDDEDDQEVKVFQEPSLPRLTEYSPSDSVFDTKSTIEISPFAENSQASSFLGDDHYSTSSLPSAGYHDDFQYMDFITNMSANEPLELDCLLNY